MSLRYDVTVTCFEPHLLIDRDVGAEFTHRNEHFTTLYLWSTGRLIYFQRLLGVSWGSNTVEVRLSWKDQTPREEETVSGCYNK